MFSRFFIDRPIFAAVLSIFFVIAGLAAMRVLPIGQYPEIAPAGRDRAGRVSRRVGRGARADRRRAARERHQRRREDALHELELVLERRGADPGHLRDRRRRRPGRAGRQQPRQAGRGQAAAGSAPPGRHRRERLLVVPAGARVLLARRPLRRPVHVELRDAQRARRAQAHPGHDQRADLRRQGLRDAHLGAARSPRAAAAHDLGRDPRDQRAERAVRRRQGRPAADRQRPGTRLHGHDAGPARRSQAVREHHRARQPRRLDDPPARSRARRARQQGLRVQGHLQRAERDARRHLPATGRQRARDRQQRQEDGRRIEAALPRRLRLRDPVRHHALRRGLDPRGRQDAARGHGARHRGGVHLPAELARDADPDHRGAGVADRHLRRPAGLWLLDQHPDLVRHGAGDRYRRRRCDRRAGERRADHARGAPRRTRSGDRGDARGHRPGDRDRAGAGVGVRADRLPRRPDRRALPPVRGHDLDRGGDLRHRRADAHALAVRADPQARAQDHEPLLQRGSTTTSSASRRATSAASPG